MSQDLYTSLSKSSDELFCVYITIFEIYMVKSL